MKATATLFVLYVFVAPFAAAQVPQQLSLTFDPGSEIMLDSVYPGTLWQVGPPEKPLFDSAYSAPNALVTDTVLSYVVMNGAEYAEFHIPMNYYGELVELNFQQRLDITQGEAWGWLEYYEPALGWNRVQNEGAWGGADVPGVVWYNSGTATVTDSGLVYLNAPEGWSSENYRFTCLALLLDEEDRGGGFDTMRFRFAFRSTANTEARDGWMIDELYTDNLGTCSGVAELSPSPLHVFPDPADDQLTVRGAFIPGTMSTIDIIDPDGRLVRSDRRMTSAELLIETGSLGAGAYLLRVADRTTVSVVRFMVQH